MVKKTLKLFPRLLLFMVFFAMLSAGVQFACITGKTPPARDNDGDVDQITDQSLQFSDGNGDSTSANDGEFVDVLTSGTY